MDRSKYLHSSFPYTRWPLQSAILLQKFAFLHTIVRWDWLQNCHALVVLNLNLHYTCYYLILARSVLLAVGYRIVSTSRFFCKNLNLFMNFKYFILYFLKLKSWVPKLKFDFSSSSTIAFIFVMMNLAGRCLLPRASKRGWPCFSVFFT